MNTDLIEIRSRITEIDNEIIELLEDRMSMAEDIAMLKEEEGMPIEDKKREFEIIEDRKMHTSLNPEFVEEVCELIFKESKRLQNEYVNNKE